MFSIPGYETIISVQDPTGKQIAWKNNNNVYWAGYGSWAAKIAFTPTVSGTYMIICAASSDQRCSELARWACQLHSVSHRSWTARLARRSALLVRNAQSYFELLRSRHASSLNPGSPQPPMNIQYNWGWGQGDHGDRHFPSSRSCISTPTIFRNSWMSFLSGTKISIPSVQWPYFVHIVSRVPLISLKVEAKYFFDSINEAALGAAEAKGESAPAIWPSRYAEYLSTSPYSTWSSSSAFLYRYAAGTL